MARGKRRGRHASPESEQEIRGNICNKTKSGESGGEEVPVDADDSHSDLDQHANPTCGPKAKDVETSQGVDDDAGCSKNTKSKERKHGARGKRRGRHASPGKEREMLAAEPSKASFESSSAEEDANVLDSKRDAADPAPSKGKNGKERRQGRHQRGRRHADGTDGPLDHKDESDDDRVDAAAQQANRRRRRGGRRHHDEGSHSDQEPAGHHQDACKQGKRASESSSNIPKHSVEKLGREANCTTFVSFKTFHGKHLAALPNGELRGKSHVIGDPEKFELSRHPDDKISLKTCHGAYVAVDRNGDLHASHATVGDQEKFELIQHAPGAVDKHTFIGSGYMCVSLRTCYGLYVAADPKGGVKANRRAVSGWESFHLKVRVQAMRCKAVEEQDIETASTGVDFPFFDACCDLEGVFNAEENYSKSHNDHVALAFAKRARARRAQGLDCSFSHFREEHRYPAAFSGCVATWDATSVFPVEEDTLEHESGVRGRSDSDFQSRHAWAAILAEESGDKTNVCVHAAFGIPAASAAEADGAAFDRLRQLSRHSRCVGIGPVGINLSEPPVGGTVKEEHCGLSASEIAAVFGTSPSKFWESPAAIYDAKRDPMCIRMVAAGMAQGSWIEEHGDRRLSQFEGACRDYARRRMDAQFKVAEEQVKLALDLGRTLIVQLPPQDEAERRMAEILLAVLGEGSKHPVLLSCFRGRPKCAAALLKHLPGLMVGFSGLLTHAKMRECLGEVAFDTPLDRVVLESLGPRYPPAVPGIGDARGSFSHPAHVRIVGEELAKVKGIEVSAVLQAAWRNVARLFKLQCQAADVRDSNAKACQEEVADNAAVASEVTPED